MVALRSICEWAQELHLAYAWASSGGGQAKHWQAIPKQKLKRTLIGIHFAQTEPAALEELRRAGCLRVIEDTAGVFHPKVLIGMRGKQARVLVGSSNFTGGGFGGNSELNVVLEGETSSAPVQRILQFFDDHWEGPRAKMPSREWLIAYERAWRRRPKPQPLDMPKGPPIVLMIPDLDVSWPQYFELICAQERRTLASGFEVHVFGHEQGCWLDEIESCLAAFEEYGSLAAMPEYERKTVAGIGGDSWGYLGNMRGAGYFKQHVGRGAQKISAALDQVPLNGPVSSRKLSKYWTRMKQINGVGFSTATRLLTVKRPDLFVSVNAGSRVRIKQIFGSSPAVPSGYQALLDRIWGMEWCTAPPPKADLQRRIWRARVALLDAVLYEPPPDA